MQINYNEIMDNLTRSDRVEKFSSRFGGVGFMEISSSNQDQNIVQQHNQRSKGIKGQTHNEKIDFNDESFCSTLESDQIVEYDYDRGCIRDDDLMMTTNKLFPCPVKHCNKVYTSSYGLKYHMDHGHTAEKMTERRPYICNVKNCGKTYKNNNGLKYHIMHAHKGVEYDESKCRL